jgi:outer membrane protein TolC
VTLREAVALALRRNPALAGAGAALAAAEGSVLASRGLDDASLSARGEVRVLRRTQALDPPLIERASEELAGSVRVAQPLPSGGRLALGFETAYARTQSDAALDPGLPPSAQPWSSALQLSLQQPLLRGFGAGVARAEQRRASSARDRASAEREGLALSLLRDVVSGYWQLAHGLHELDIRRASAAAARDQLERVHASIGVGKLPPSAAAEIEVVIALREDAVLLAKQRLTERELSLGRLCGVAEGEPLRPSQPLPALAPAAPAERDFNATLAAALAHSPQLQALSAQGRTAAVELEVGENGLLPQLDLSLAGGPAGSAAEAHAAFEQLVSFSGYALQASLSLELPLARHAARGALVVAHGNARGAQLDAADVTAQLRAAVASALALLETARRRAALLVPSQRAAALDLESERARFEVGRASNFDVLRRQDALAAVQLLLLRAELERLEAEATLDALTGELFVQHGVVLGRGER